MEPWAIRARDKRTQLATVPRLDKHHEAILNFIRKNPGCSENRVVRAMNEQDVCSKMTTLNKLDQLIKMEEVYDLLKHGKSRSVHTLYVNKESAFHRINKELSIIQSLIDQLDLSSDAIYKRAELEKKNKGSSSWMNAFRNDFEYQFLLMVFTLLSLTLTRINKLIKSKRDSRILYDRVIKILLKLVNRSSKTLPWDLLDTELEDLRIMATSQQLFEWVNERLYDRDY